MWLRQEFSPGHRTQIPCSPAVCRPPAKCVHPCSYVSPSFLFPQAEHFPAHGPSGRTCRRSRGLGGEGDLESLLPHPPTHDGVFATEHLGGCPVVILWPIFLKDFLGFTLVLLCAVLHFPHTPVSQALVFKIQLPPWFIIILSFLDLFTIYFFLCALLRTVQISPFFI